MPELTIVMAGSNDNYGGEAYRDVEPAVPTPFKDRVALSMLTIPYAFDKINYEIIFVVWNEDPERESLFTWDCLKHPRIRLVEVPKSLASKVEPDRQFHETWAKNVGIRRARSDMILCTNPDIMWLDEFPRDVLHIDSVMIAHRWSVYHPVLELRDIGALQTYCRQENNHRDSDMGANGDFTMMPRMLWFRLNGLSTPRQEAMAGVDQWQVERAREITGKVYRYPYSIWHVRHPGRPLQSSFGETYIHPEWGFPNELLEEWCGGERIKL
jgi:hypothetical protein